MSSFSEMTGGRRLQHLEGMLAALFPLVVPFSLLVFTPYRKLAPGPSPGELILVAALGLLLPKLLRLPRANMPGYLGIGMLMLVLLLLSATFQQLTGPAPAFKAPLRWLTVGAMYLAVFMWLCTDSGFRSKVLISLLLGAGSLTVLMNCFQFVLGPDLSMTLMPWGPFWTIWYTRMGFRTYSFFDNPLLAGCILTVLLPLVWGRALEQRHWFFWGLGVFFAFGIALTGSRSCILVAFLLTALQLIPRLSTNLKLVTLAGLVSLFVLFLVSPFGARLVKAITAGKDGNLSQRIVAAEAGFEILSDHPWLGVGPGLFALAYERHYKPMNSQDHHSSYTLDNFLFQIACESGLPLGLIVLATYLYLLSSAAKLEQLRPRGMVYTILAFGLLSLAVAIFYTPIMWLFMVIVALVETDLKTLHQANQQVS